MMVKGPVFSCIWYHVIQMASLVRGHVNLTPGNKGVSCVDLSGESENNKCKESPQNRKKATKPFFP